MITYYLATLSLIPYFTARTFLPLFMTAMTARFGVQWALLADYAGVQMLSSVPATFTSDLVLLVLGALAAGEVLALKNPELREFLTLFDSKIKALAVFLVAFVMVGGEPLDLVGSVEQSGFLAFLTLGQGFAYAWCVGLGALVWLAAVTRGLIFNTLIELDEDDDLGLQGMLSWLEDAFGFFGVLFALILPTVAVLVVGLTLLGLFLTRRYLEHLEKAARVPCRSCGEPVMPCGVRCGRCGEPSTVVLQVGWFGRILGQPAFDLEDHRQNLIARKRCPSCGERFAERRVDQRCTTCGTEPFASPAVLEAYLARLRASLPKTLAVLLLLGLVPVLGLIPGVIYYRCSLIASLRCYLPRSSSFLMRWAVRLINLVLIGLQPIPLFGMVTLPCMCLINFLVYQSALRRQGRLRLQARPALAV